MHGVKSFAVVPLLGACAQPPAVTAPPAADALVPALLWRSGCGACGISTDVEAPSGVERHEQNARAALQTVTIDGDVATGFTIDLPEAPPQLLLDTYFHYPTAAFVLLREGGSFGFHRDESIAESGFTFPILLQSEVEDLGVASMAPLYVAYVDGPERISDENIAPGEILAPGFHLARHDGVATRASVEQLVCSTFSVDDDCGEPIFAYKSARRLGRDEPTTFAVGGDEELVDVLGALTGDDL